MRLVVNVPLSLATSILVTRLLGPWGRGVYSSVVLIWTFGWLILTFGQPNTNACFPGKKKYHPSQLFTNSLLLSLFSLVVVAVATIAWLAYPRLLPFEELPPPYVMVALFLVPVGVLSKCLSNLIQGLNRIVAFNGVLLIGPVAFLVLLGVLVGALHMGVSGALIAWAVAQCLTLVSSLVVLGKSGETVLSLSFSPALAREGSSFGLQSYVGGLISTMNFRLDMFLVLSLLGAEGVGYYSVAVSTSELLYLFPVALATPLVPGFAAASSTEARRLVNNALRIVVGIGVGATFVGLVLASPAIRFVYGEKFLPSILPFQVLLPGVAMYGMAHITTAYFNAFVGKPWINTLLAGISLVVDIGLALILIPRFGVPGAAVASSIAYILSVSIALTVYAKLSGATLAQIFLPTKQERKHYLSWIRGRIDTLRYGAQEVH